MCAKNYLNFKFISSIKKLPSFTFNVILGNLDHTLKANTNIHFGGISTSPIKFYISMWCIFLIQHITAPIVFIRIRRQFTIYSLFSLDGPSYRCCCLSALKMSRNLLTSNAGGGSPMTRLLLLSILHLIVNGKKECNKRITQKHCCN
jgi:hypothetical protein